MNILKAQTDQEMIRTWFEIENCIKIDEKLKFLPPLIFLGQPPLPLNFKN